MGLESNARMLIVPASMPGKVMHALTGTSEQLIRQGRISSHHRIAGADGVEIDVWVKRGLSDFPSHNQGQTAVDKQVLQHSSELQLGRENLNVPFSPARGSVVMIHPLLCGKTYYLAAGQKLSEMGFDVVLPDLRAHGKSGGQYITWGAKEKLDVKAVMDRLIGEGVVNDRIYAVGSSMGAAVAVQYAAIEPRCRGVMAIAPPQSGREICRRILLMASPRAFQEALARACELADFNIDDASAETAAAQLACPLLLIHGIWDVIVPYQHSQAILRAARGPKKLQPQFLHGHAPDFGRTGFIVQQFTRLVEMSKRGLSDFPSHNQGQRAVEKRVLQHNAGLQSGRENLNVPFWAPAPRRSLNILGLVAIALGVIALLMTGRRLEAGILGNLNLLLIAISVVLELIGFGAAAIGASLGLWGLLAGLIRKRTEVITPIIGLALNAWALLAGSLGAMLR